MDATLRSGHSWLYGGLSVLWLGLVCSGVHLLWAYKSTPGAAALAPARWPADSGLMRAQNVPTLLMFAHPRCSCTRASLTELSRLVARQRGLFQATLVFAQPEGAPEDWLDSDTVRSAQRLEGVQVRVDTGGAEAKRFGSATSGQVLLYSQTGRLLFSGGITGSRGHEGDNLGRARVAALIGGSAPDRRMSPVFGCALEKQGRP